MSIATTAASKEGRGPADSGDTLSQVALRRIIQLIRNGELRPGDLVLEAPLSKHFGMSRGPIREAIRELEGRKLLTRQPFQRARVVEIDKRQIRDIFEAREALEGMACRLATQRMSDEALSGLVEAVQATKTSDYYSFMVTGDHFNFHLAVVGACGNQRIQQMLTAEVYDLVRLWRWASNTPLLKAGPVSREHWQICRAMLARDEYLAESLMRKHIQQCTALVPDAPP